MITFTAKAHEKVQSFIQSNQGKNTILRVRISGRSLNGFSYQFFLEGPENKRVNDTEFDSGTLKVRADQADMKDLEGCTVDWVEEEAGSGFKVDNPNPPMPHLNHPLARKIQDILDKEINPSLAAHGGGAEIVDLKDDGKLFLRLGGGCQGCGMASATLRQGIETRLKELFPEIKEIVDATDHSSGQNPYYHT